MRDRRIELLRRCERGARQHRALAESLGHLRHREGDVHVSAGQVDVRRRAGAAAQRVDHSQVGRDRARQRAEQPTIEVLVSGKHVAAADVRRLRARGAAQLLLGEQSAEANDGLKRLIPLRLRRERDQRPVARRIEL